MKQFRVRIAPSPTGVMHVGTARTALFNWLFVKKHSGVFILRIEDTDKERSRKEYEENIIKGIEWLGLDYSEFYRQSERTKIYTQYIKKLLDSGMAFYCYHSKEELENEKAEQTLKKQAPKHICSYRDNTTSRPAPLLKTAKSYEGGGDSSIIRFNNPGGKIKFTDIIRGEIAFDADLFGDFSIAKGETAPLYNFAAAIDDYDMKISHVIRGEDHISNTPKQLLIYQALGLESPKFAHLPMILGSDKSKLSKRHGATSLLEYRDRGYLPEAMFNFLSLLGWSSGDDREIMTREEIVKKFSLEAVQKSGAVFNIEKLDWMNGEYIRQMPLDQLTELCMPYLKKAYDMRYTRQGRGSPQAATYDIQKIVALEQPRMKKLAEIGESTTFFFTDKLEYDKELLLWKNMSYEEIAVILGNLSNLLTEIPEEAYTKEKLEEIIMPKAEEWGKIGEKIDRGRTLWPLRVALTGRKASPGPFEVMDVMGKKMSLNRIQDALSKLEANKKSGTEW